MGEKKSLSNFFKLDVPRRKEFFQKRDKMVASTMFLGEKGTNILRRKGVNYPWEQLPPRRKGLSCLEEQLPPRNKFPNV